MNDDESGLKREWTRERERRGEERSGGWAI